MPIIIIDQKYRMNSPNATNQNNRWYCCFFMILLAGLIALSMDLQQISAYKDIQKQIHGNFQSKSCSELCGYGYYEKNGQCCWNYDSTDCRAKSKCISNWIASLQYQQNSIILAIIIFSVASGIFILGFIVCICCYCKKIRNQNQNQVLMISEAGDFDINRSLRSNQSKINTQYESFAHVDEENACCICLEQFKNEKVILLKCGHIYHSACIRDWAVKQENCPVCRSSQ